MHEAVIAQTIIENIEARIEEGQIVGRVRSICLTIGKLTSVIPDNLRFMFRVLSKGSILEGVGLKIEQVPIQAKCLSCGAHFEIEDLCFSCKKCNSPDVDVISGRELLVKSVEVE